MAAICYDTEANKSVDHNQPKHRTTQCADSVHALRVALVIAVAVVVVVVVVVVVGGGGVVVAVVVVACLHVRFDVVSVSTRLVDRYRH